MTHLRRTLGFWDLVLFYIVTSFSIRWIATAAAALLVITVGSVAFNFRLQRSRAAAEANAAVARQRVVAQHLREASRLSAEGDVFAGLASLTKALREVQRDSPLEGTVRERVGCTLQFFSKASSALECRGNSCAASVHLRQLSPGCRIA